MIRRGVLALVALASLAFPAAAHAQTKERAAMKDGLELYDKGEYVEALHKLQEIQEGLVLLDAPEQVTVHKYRAYCMIVLQEIDAAKKEFKAALEVDPSFDLDPNNTSPKILSVFQEVKHRVELPAPSHAAAMSAVAPGWGQYRTKRHTAAWVSPALVGAGVVALVVTQMNAGTADGYVAKAGSLDKTKFKNQAAQYDTIRDVAAVALVGAWAGGIWDAYHGASRAARAPKAGAPVALRVEPVVAPGGAALLLSGEF